MWIFSLHVAMALLLPALAAVALPAREQFRVERLEERQLLIASCVTGSSQKLPVHQRTGVRPIVQVSTCHPLPSLSDPDGHWADYTLLVEAQEMGNTTQTHGHDTIGCALPRWKVELPDSLSLGIAAQCIEVYIQGTPVGPGPPILGIRTKLARNSSTEHPLVTMVSSNGSQHYIQYSDTGSTTVIPECIHSSTTYSGAPHWVVLWNTSCGDNSTYFSPSHLHVVSINSLYLQGNALLYSPNRGETFYQLLLPSSVDKFGSFAMSSDRTYAFTAAGTNASGIWVGFEGTSELLQVYPLRLLERVWEVAGIQWNDSSLQSTSLEFDGQDKLYVVDNTSSVTLPLSLLLPNAAYLQRRDGPTSSSPPDNPGAHELTNTLLHELLTTLGPTTCPYLSVAIYASVCRSVSRSKVMVAGEGALKWRPEGSLPSHNCSIATGDPPRSIFLGISESYTFYVHFLIDPLQNEPSAIYYLVSVSSPAVVQVEMAKTFHSSNNTVSYAVSLQEKSSFAGQVASGHAFAAVEVTFKVWGPKGACIDPSSGKSHTPGDLETQVYVGCPPGLSLLFDSERTTEKYTQYCLPTNNISCYYFSNEFEPVFELVDSIVEERVTYTGPYTLRALAGGTSLNDLRAFHGRQNVESELWTPVKDEYNLESNKIKWVCGTTSPCGEIVPEKGRRPEYYLVIEASNRDVGATGTYCEFKVQFTVRIHGMGMGSVTVATTLMSFVSVLAAVTLGLFGLWHFKLKLYYLRDVGVDHCRPRLSQTRRAVTECVQRHKARVTPSYPESK